MGNLVNEKNYEQWSGVAEKYHTFRPVPPEAITHIICTWLKKEPGTVIDVGCGTGLSTIIWEDIAQRIIGIEPNDDMRATAEKHNHSIRVSFVKGVSNEINLPSDFADVVTVSQAFHFMDIDSTLVEFHRILKEGGVLAIYDFSPPPMMDWEIEKAFLALRKKSSEIYYSQDEPPVLNDKRTYLDRISTFGKFRYAREFACHSFEKWPLQRVIDLAVHTTNASFAMRVDDTIQKDIDAFVNLIKEKNNNDMQIGFTYQMVLAVK